MGDEYVVRAETSDRVSGDLVHIILDTYEWQGEEKNTIKLYLEDEAEGEVVIIDARLNNLTRSIFNSLFALESFKNVELSLYSVKDKQQVDWPAASVWQDGERVMWKYKPEEQPKVEKLMDSRGKVKGQDSFAIDAFYVEKLTELAARVKAARSSSTPATNPAPAPVTTNVTNVTQVAPAPQGVAVASKGKRKAAQAPVTTPASTENGPTENIDEDIPF